MFVLMKMLLMSLQRDWERFCLKSLSNNFLLNLFACFYFSFFSYVCEVLRLRGGVEMFWREANLITFPELIMIVCDCIRSSLFWRHVTE
jgi:hypothetical protein